MVDPDVNRADAVAREFGCKAFGSVQQMLTTHSELQAASVAAPTVHHLSVARELMNAGVDVLIEKPLAASLAEADELVAVGDRGDKRIAQVGHLERFNPAVRATLPILTQPMFFEVHRLSVFTPRSLDVDVVLDLMIHDLDIVLAFAKSAVKEVRAVGLPILSGKVDIANVRLEFESGCVANFTASRVSTERVRKLRFFQPRQYVSLDYGRQEVLVFTVGEDGTAGNPFGQSADRSQQASGSFRRAAACGVEVVFAGCPASVPLRSFRWRTDDEPWPWRWRFVDAIREHGKKVNLAALARRSVVKALPGISTSQCPSNARSSKRCTRPSSSSFTYVYTPQSSAQFVGAESRQRCENRSNLGVEHRAPCSTSNESRMQRRECIECLTTGGHRGV